DIVAHVKDDELRHRCLGAWSHATPAGVREVCGPVALAPARVQAALLARDARGAIDSLVYGSEPMDRVMAKLLACARSDATVLLTGESGTGKDAAVKFLHVASPRAVMPLVSYNFTAIPEALAEGLLFGAERGA